MDLSRARSTGMNANPISYSDIAAYSSLMGAVMLPWEVKALRMVDMAALEKMNQPEAHKPPPVDPEAIKSAFRAVGVTSA